jgi:hypothetical protein
VTGVIKGKNGPYGLFIKAGSNRRRKKQALCAPVGSVQKYQKEKEEEALT